tara:strand:+ start:206 stop:430 length:225 start_codon:yes stop_codon:yes gene_type:complete
MWVNGTIQPERDADGKIDIVKELAGEFEGRPYMFYKLAVLAREYQNNYGGSYKQAIAYIKKDLKFLLLTDKGND